MTSTPNPYVLAVIKQDIPALRELIDTQTPGINGFVLNRWTALHYACWLYAEKARFAFASTDTANTIVAMLIEAGAEMDKRTEDGEMPHMVASGFVPPSLAQILRRKPSTDFWDAIPPPTLFPRRPETVELDPSTVELPAVPSRRQSAKRRTL